MEAAAIFELVQKGLLVIGALISAGMSAAPAIEALSKLVSGAQTEEVTSEDLARTEALLDSLIAEFNLDLPEA